MSLVQKSGNCLSIPCQGLPSAFRAGTEKKYLFSLMLVCIGKLGQLEQGKADPRQSCDGITPAESKKRAAPQVNILADSALQTGSRGTWIICLLPTKGKGRRATPGSFSSCLVI